MCLACSLIMYGKFTVKPDWAMLIMKQLGKPRMCMPWSVLMPSLHFLRLRVTPFRPTSS